MAYRIIEGRLQRQDVQGGRWQIVDRDEEIRAMEILSRAMVESSKSAAAAA